MARPLPGKWIPLRSINLSMEDVRTVYRRLLEQMNDEADRLLANWVRPEGKSEEEFEAEKANFRNSAFRLTVTIEGRDGERLFDDDIRIFDSPNLPQVIGAIYMTNISAFETTTGYKPINSFFLLLDFSKPPLLDTNSVSVPTPNNSHLDIGADREAWIAAISQSVLGITDNRKNKRSFLHKAYVYDLGLILFGLPASLYLAYKLSAPIEEHLGSINLTLAVTAYIYVVLSGILIYRIFFGYTKWAFPSLELDGHSDAASKHRRFWWAIVFSPLIANVVWEFLT